MKTLSDFKRALIKGSEWIMQNHYYKGGKCARHVNSTNTVGVRFGYYDTEGNSRESCLDWPKACNIEFGADGEVKVFAKWQDNDRYHLLSYWKV